MRAWPGQKAETLPLKYWLGSFGGVGKFETGDCLYTPRGQMRGGRGNLTLVENRCHFGSTPGIEPLKFFGLLFFFFLFRILYRGSNGEDFGFQRLRVSDWRHFGCTCGPAPGLLGVARRVHHGLYYSKIFLNVILA